MIKLRDVWVVLAMLVLVGCLIWLHAPGLGIGLPLARFDRSHDFWGGLLVEMIGVAVELALIIMVLTQFQERRWAPVRASIINKLHLAIRQEVKRCNTLERLLTFEPGSDGHDELLTFLHARVALVDQRYKSLSDFLQYSNNAFTPEMSDCVADFMSAYSQFAAEQSTFVELMERSHLGMNRDEHRTLQFVIDHAVLSPLRAMRIM